MKLLRKLFLFFLATVAITAVFAQNTEPEFSLHLAMQQDAVKLGSLIKGKIILTNTSGHDREVYGDRSRDAQQSGFTIEFLDAQGKAPELRSESISIWSIGHLTLKPGGTTYYILDLTNMYNVTQPGTYTVQVQFLDEITNTLVKSNKVIVTVTK